MKALLIAAYAAAGLCVLLAAASAGGESSGVQYDEISRVITPGSTPPPPGSFAADAAAMHNGVLTTELQPPPGTPQAPQMPGFNPASLLGAIFNPLGLLMGFGMQALAQSMAHQQTNHARQFESGHLQRMAFFGSTAREEFVSKQTVTITDLSTHKQTQLDLANRTYKIVDAPEAPAMPPGSGEQGSPGGTVAVDLHSSTSVTGNQTVDGIGTDVYHTVASVNATGATGACHDVSMQFETTRYVAQGIAVPVRASDTLDEMLTSHPGAFSGENCSATVTKHLDGASIPANRLIVFSVMSMKMQPPPQAQAMGAGAMTYSMVTERGNIKPVTAADAAALFAVPAGFVRAQ